MMQQQLASIGQRPETMVNEENMIFDPNYKSQANNSGAQQLNPDAHRTKYTSQMNSNVGKIITGNVGEELQIPNKRMRDPTVSNFNNNLIGGQAAQGDPYQTVQQMMNNGEGLDKKESSRKKMLRPFEPELFVSPITGEPIADYGSWKEDISKPKAAVTKESTEPSVPDDPILAKLKSQLSMRGAKGIVGLGRLFKIMDDDGSNSLSFPEFKKAMKEFGMALNDTELVILFKRFGKPSKICPQRSFD